MKVNTRKWGLIILTALILGVGGWGIFNTLNQNQSVLILEGTIVTPEEVIPHGWIVVDKGRISRVSDSQPNIENGIVIDTGGIIFPGLIDLHNHVSWNVIPRWDPNDFYLNRYEWRTSQEYYQLISHPFNELNDNHFCDMNTYGEVRAIIGGVTSIIATWNRSCIDGLVRNLDFHSGFYNFPSPGDRTHILDEVDLPLDTGEIKDFLWDDDLEAFFLHLAEGTGLAMKAEFDQLVDQRLLTRKTVLIHGTALDFSQFQTMAKKDASLLWSPRSNLELYGTTANILWAREAGVKIALGPDWAITGSSNILDELRYANAWNEIKLGGLLRAEDLVDMVTINPAVIAGIDDEVGKIQAGLRADLLIIDGDSNDPYRSLVQADPNDVSLVIIDGVPIYGTPLLMETFWGSKEVSRIEILGEPMMLHYKGFNDLVTDLQSEMTGYGLSLAPLAEPVDPRVRINFATVDVDVGSPASDPSPTGEIEWNDAIYYFGDDRVVCGPVISTAFSNQSAEKNTYLNLGEPYPDINRFTVLIKFEDRNNFNQAPEDFYKFETICVAGTIESYQGVATIFVSNPLQIEIQ